MTTETKTVELAKVTGDGYELCGDFADVAEATEAAKDFGPGEYAYTTDPGGGHYEGSITVPDGVTVFVVRDASAEYVRDQSGDRRTPASNEAFEFETREEAEAACTRHTDRVFNRTVHDE